MEEMLEIYDQDLTKIGCKPRSIVHQMGYLHAVCHLWITDLENHQIFYQRRSLDKDSFPGYYDTTSAGHIGVNELPVHSMLREAQEEIGLTLKASQLIHLGVTIEHLGLDHEICYIYTTDLKNPHFDLGPEVIEMVSLDISQFLKDQDHYLFLDATNKPRTISKDRICPHHLTLIRDYLKQMTGEKI